MCYTAIKVSFLLDLAPDPIKLRDNLFFLSGIAGTITSLACAPHHVGSTSLDRFFRLHGTASDASGGDRKGQTLEKVYSKSIPTVVVWDPSYEDGKSSPSEDDEGEGDRVWEDMEGATDT